jgi:hypothetical protein
VESDDFIGIVCQPGIPKAWSLTTDYIPKAGAFLGNQQLHQTGYDSEVLHADITTPTMVGAVRRTDLIGDLCVGEVFAVSSL